MHPPPSQIRSHDPFLIYEKNSVLSAIQASDNKVLNEIGSFCKILYLVYSANFLSEKTEGEHTQNKSCCV